MKNMYINASNNLKLEVKESIKNIYDFINSKEFKTEGFCNTQLELLKSELDHNEISLELFHALINLDMEELTLERIYEILGL